MKTIEVKKTANVGAKIAKNDAIKLQDGKQLYRLFKGIDESAYTLQGEATICALRSGRYAQAEQRKNGKIVWLGKGAQGYAVFVGADIGKGMAQSGAFILDVSKWQRFSDWSAFTAHIAKHGTAVKINGTAGRWLEGSKYSFYVLNGAKAAKRHESNTCARGKRFFANVN
jgi:hypothetical protein